MLNTEPAILKARICDSERVSVRGTSETIDQGLRSFCRYSSFSSW
jgi:hypothetical protein